MFTKNRKRPFIKILAAFVLGIIAAGFIDFDLWIIYILAVFFGLIAFFSKDLLIKSAYTTFVVVLVGVILAIIHRPQDDLPMDTKLCLGVSIEKINRTDSRWTHATATVDYYSQADSLPSVWHSSRQRINLYVDTTIHVNLAERLLVRGYVNPLSSTSRSYIRLMSARGLGSSVYINSTDNIIAREAQKTAFLATLSSRINAYALSHLDALKLDSTSLALAKTMTTGARAQINSSLRNSYSNTGTAHLLAVSGLHTGFVFLALSLLFWWVPLFDRGHIYKTVFIVLGLWLFALMALMSASVVRAALMLTIAQLSLSLSRKVDRYNILFGAAVVMLAINPMWIYDISFQLSFMAVLSILFFLPRMLRIVRFKRKALRYIWSIFMVGLAAQVGIIPLLGYNFGILPLVGLLITPLLLIPAFTVMAVSLFWVVLPLPFMNGSCSWIISLAARLQNSIVDHVAGWSWASININLDGRGIAIYYAFMLVLMAAIKYYEQQHHKIQL